MRLAVAMFAFMVACLAGVHARALDPNRTIAQFRHTAWTTRDGLPPGVHAIAQTPDGYLWLGTVAGLYRFDGVRFEAIDRHLHINALTVAPGGDLWIGAESGLARLDHGVISQIAFPLSMTDVAVRLMAPGGNGDLWIATNSQVARFDRHKWQVMQADWGTSAGWTRPGGIWALAVARDGVVWAKNGLDLYFLRPGATRFVKAPGYAGGVINFALAADGRLWTADTLLKRFYALPELGRSEPPPPPAQIGAPAPPGVLAWVLFDRDGTLWDANQVTGGVYRVRQVLGAAATPDSYFRKDGLTNNATHSIYEDREGNIWIGTHSGLDRFAPANVVIETGISIRGQNEYVTASHAAVYVADGWASNVPGFGHDVETVYRIADGPPQALPIRAPRLNFLFATGDDVLLFGIGDKLFQWRRGVVSSVVLPEQARGGSVGSAAENDNDLWVVVDGKGVFRRRYGVWTGPLKGVSANLGTHVELDARGSAWLFDPNNVAVRLTGDRVKAFQPHIGYICAFVPDPDGVMVLGQFGVSRFDGRVFHTLTEDQAPWLKWVAGVVSDDRGGTWLSTLAGIYRVATAQLERAFVDPSVRLDGQLLDARDGLKSTTSVEQFGNQAVRGPDGRLWFVTVDNVAWIDPHHFYRNLVPPPVSVQSVMTQGRVFDADAVRRLPAGASNLQIDYTALSLQNPERVRFRYQLDGVDKGWVEAGGRRQAFYTRLGPGHYRFRVIAANNDGVWNTTGETLDFEIPPTFVQSGWFLMLCVVVAGLLLWAAYRWRVQQVTAAIQARLEERVAERERIARELHDTLLQGFQGLILRLHAIMLTLPQSAPPRTQMEAALDQADEVLVSGRDRVRQLRTHDDRDLAESLVAIAEGASEVSNTAFRLIVEGAPRSLHPVVAEEFTAIGGEAILNAFHHAGALNINATLAYNRHALSLRVIDDGQGIDASTLAEGRAGHFGLTGMRERAEKIKAKFSISSRPGAGCEIAVAAPAQVAYASAREELSLLSRLHGFLNSLALPFGVARRT